MASLFSSARLTSAYTALRGELGAPQSATDTIDKLVERIQTAALVEDRRTAVLGLKGLSRDWREDVGSRSLPSLIAILQHDAPYDVEIAKAVLETLMQLTEVGQKPAKDDAGLRFTDEFLAEPGPFHSLLSLLATSPSFYPRFYVLQFLSSLLTHRCAVSQSYLMSSPPPGLEGVLSVLDPVETSKPSGNAPAMGGGASEMLRNEALLLLPTMLAGNADLQKIVAFSGAFEKLLGIISTEGGIEGGIVVQDALVVVGGLLRFNVSNQNYFRELSLIPQLPSFLLFPSPLPAPDGPVSDEFALQFWPEQKIINAGLVLGLIRMLVGGPGGGNQSAMVPAGVTRCLLELSLASNAPSALKAQALNTLTPIMLSSPQNQNLMTNLRLSPLVPIHADDEHPNGGFVRLDMKPAVVALVGTVVEGDGGAGGRGLRSRAAGVNMFEAYVSGNDDARLGILSTLVVTPGEQPETAGAVLLSGLLDLPAPEADFDPYRPLFACLLLSHLIRNSEHAKKIARELALPSAEGEDDEDRVTLVQAVVGNLMMASREQTESKNRATKEGRNLSGPDAEEEDWTRVVVGYLVLLCTWLWDSPKTVREFLDEGANLQVLIQPVAQSNGVDPLVQGLCAFLLGVCYEFNREPGEITRTTLHPILHSRIGPDQFVSRMARLRDDARFKAVQPDAFDTEAAPDASAAAEGEEEEIDEGLELWFDWAFVDFWKNHYYTIQRSIAIDPDAVRGSGGADDGETAAIIMSLRQKLKLQTEEAAALNSKLAGLSKEHDEERSVIINEVQSLSEQVSHLTTALQEAQATVASREDTIAKLRVDLDAQTAKVIEAQAKPDVTLEHTAALLAARKDLDTERDAHAETRKGTEFKAALEALQKQLDEERAAHEKTKEKVKVAAGPPVKGELKKLREELEAAKSKTAESDKAQDELKKLKAELVAEQTKRAENEKEQEDLLVLLEELSQKRKKDKERMKAAELEVSEGEDDGDEDDDE